MEQFSYYIPTRILFGAGALKRLSEQQLPGKRALIVTTGGQSVIKYGYLAELENQLSKAGVDYIVFNKILPNPVLEHVTEGARLCRGNHLDFVVGLGGGSAIDSAKAIAVNAANPGDYWDYISGGSGKGKPLAEKPLPVVAVTTTAGTGTEADPWTVTTRPETNEKIGFGCDGTFPVLSVVDPELMRTVPPYLTACQGFDALFHSMEGYLHRNHNEISDMFALKSIELIGKSLAAAVADGNDMDARGDVALANTLAGMVESLSGCISQHSLEHALSAYHPKLEHGAGLIALCRAYFSRFAQKPECAARMKDMARALGKEGKDPAEVPQALDELMKACGVDGIRLSGYGITEDELPQCLRNARETMGGLFGHDPVPMSDGEALEIYRESYC